MKLYKYNNEKLDFIPVNRLLYLTKYIGITIGICLSVGLFTSLKYIENEKKEFIESEQTINLITNNSFSDSTFVNYIKHHSFKYPEIIIAQAYIESTHFTSPVWNENNNMFGMRLPQSRFTLAIGENLKHAVYKNWKDCVKDRLIYEALYLHKLNREQYYAYLDRVYARSNGVSYSDLIKRVIKDKALE